MQEKLLIEKLNRKEFQGKDGAYWKKGIFANGKWYGAYEGEWNKDWAVGSTIEVTTEKTTGKDGKTYYNILSPESKKVQTVAMQEQLDRIESKIDKLLGV